MDSHLIAKSHKLQKRKMLRDKILIGIFMAIYLPIEIIVSLTLGPILMPFISPSEDEL